MRSVTQAELVALAVGGDGEAFARLVAPHLRKIKRHVRGMVGNDTDAEDVVQDALVLAWRGLRTFRGASSLYTWLYRVGHNAALSFLKRSARRLPPVASFAPDAGDDKPDDGSLEPAHYETPERVYEAIEWLERLQGSLDRLPEERRAAFLACAVDGCEYEQAARDFDVPIGTVRSRLHRAREELGLLRARP